MDRGKSKIIAGYAEKWPREIFDIKDGNKLLASVQDKLKSPGVYVLYRDDHPYYIGKTKGPLFRRIWGHANASRDKYYNFWNYFSAFAITNDRSIDEIEALLIASMLTVNSATPKIPRISMPRDAARILQRERKIYARKG